MLTVEERFGRNRSDATVPMAGVVPGEERLAVRSLGLEGAGGDVLLCDGIPDELLGEYRGLARRHHPADDVAPDYFEDDVQVKLASFDFDFQLGDDPTPHFVHGSRKQFGFFIDRMDPLFAALAALVACLQQTGLDADRAVKLGYVKTGCENAGRRQVDEAIAVEDSKHRILFNDPQLQRRP